MSKRNRIFIKIILLILLVSISVVSISCSYVQGGYNYLFKKLSDAEWQSAMSIRKFSNVTISLEEYQIKIVNRIPYDNDEKMQDYDAMIVEIILSLIKNCKHDDFTYDYKNDVYSCDEVSYSLVYYYSEFGANVDVTVVATNIILFFNDENELEQMNVDLYYKLDLMGYTYEQDGGGSCFFSNYGTTTINK